VTPAASAAVAVHAQVSRLRVLDAEIVCPENVVVVPSQLVRVQAKV
jgi:hypothetical protein